MKFIYIIGTLLKIAKENSLLCWTAGTFLCKGIWSLVTLLWINWSKISLCFKCWVIYSRLREKFMNLFKASNCIPGLLYPVVFTSSRLTKGSEFRFSTSISQWLINKHILPSKTTPSANHWWPSIGLLLNTPLYL